MAAAIRPRSVGQRRVMPLACGRAYPAVGGRAGRIPAGAVRYSGSSRSSTQPKFAFTFSSAVPASGSRSTTSIFE